MSIQGLLTVKPANTPVVGAVKLFTVEQRMSANGKPWNKIKSTAADAGGIPYRIMSLTPTGRTDQYGNISFNVELDADPSAQPTPPQPRQDARGNGGSTNWDERSGRIERQHSQEMALRYCALNGLTVSATATDQSDGKITKEMFVALVSWFQRDIGRPPMADLAKEMFNATEVNELRRDIEPVGDPKEDEIPYE